MLRIFYHFFPFALVTIHQRLHFSFPLRNYTQAIVYHHIAQVLNTAFHFVEPGSGACERVGGGWAELEEGKNGAEGGI